MRCYILDNHRPIHLKNIYSRDNVVVFDEEFYPDDDNDLPSEASEMSSVVGEDDSGLESEEDDFDEEDDEEEDEDEEAGEAEEEGEGDEEFNVSVFIFVYRFPWFPSSDPLSFPTQSPTISLEKKGTHLIPKRNLTMPRRRTKMWTKRKATLTLLPRKKI